MDVFGHPRFLDQFLDAENKKVFMHSEFALFCLKNCHVRERSFLILGTRTEDFWQGYETFLHFLVGVRKFQEQILMGYKTIFIETILDEAADQRLKEKLRNIWK